MSTHDQRTQLLSLSRRTRRVQKTHAVSMRPPTVHAGTSVCTCHTRIVRNAKVVVHVWLAVVPLLFLRHFTVRCLAMGRGKKRKREMEKYDWIVVEDDAAPTLAAPCATARTRAIVREAPWSTTGTSRCTK